MNVLEILKELQKQKSKQFDPLIVDAFCKLSSQIKFKKYLSLMVK